MFASSFLVRSYGNPGYNLKCGSSRIEPHLIAIKITKVYNDGKLCEEYYLMLKKIRQDDAVDLAVNEAKNYIDEKEFTLKLFKCFDLTENQYNEYKKMTIIKLEEEKKCIEIEIEKQNKYTSDFRLNFSSILIAIISVFLAIVVATSSNTMTQIVNINEKVDSKKQILNDSQHTYANGDETYQENNSKEVSAQSSDLNEQIEQLNAEKAIKQTILDLANLVLIFLCIALFITAVFSIYFFRTYERNNKRSAIILVAYKKRLDYIEELIKKKPGKHFESNKNKVANIKGIIIDESNSCNEQTSRYYYREKLFFVIALSLLTVLIDIIVNN